MRKLILATALALLATSAFAEGPRGLSSQQPAAAQAAELQKPIRRAEVTVLPAPGEQPATTPAPSMEDKLRAAGELKPDGTPSQPALAPAPAPAPVQAQAPVQPQPAPAPVQATAPAAAKPAVQAQSHKPARKHVAHRGESNERKARRIAARFGVYW